MAKEALYLVQHEIDRASAAEWAAFHSREHVPRVVAAAGFLGAQRFEVKAGAASPESRSRYRTVYRAASLAVVRGYLEGGEVGKMRALHDAWLEARKVRATISYETLEENYSVDEGGRPLARSPEMAGTVRAVLALRARLDPSAAPGWSTWYDRDQLPAVVRAGGFLRAGRWRVVDEAAGRIAFAVLYEAAGTTPVEGFLDGPGRRFAREEEGRFGESVHLSTEVWAGAA